MKEKIVHKTLKEMENEWKDELVNELYGENFYLIEEYNKQKEVLDKIKEIINHYAVEDEDYSKIYNKEEQEIMKLLEEIEEPKDHKIPEKLDYKYENIYHNISKCKHSEIRIIDKINEILDYLEEIK